MDISEPGASSINVQPDLEQPLERGKIATLPELYKHAIDKITLFLDKDPWIAREIESALILDDCLIRLKIWSQEIGSEMVLAQVEKHVVLYSPTKYFLVHINNAIKDFVSLREEIAGWPTTRVGEIRDVMSRLRQYVTNLSSHIIPFVAVGESANRAGPIYELHTRKNKTPRLATSISKIAPSIISKGSQNTVEVLLPVDAAEPQGVREEERHQLFMASEGLSHLKGSDTADAMMRVVYSVLSRHSLFHSFPFMNLNERGKRLIRWCRIKDEKEASLLARYEYRLLGSRCSLRMLKLLPTLFGEVIKCELTEVHPRDVQPNQPLTWNCEPFEAISWVWSRDERNRTICIGDGTQWFSLQIPPALASCLAALRLDDKPRHIWIDFLCSDRSNPQELSDQPFIFHSIFAAAERVCAWLGNGNDNSDLAINFIKTTSSTHDSWQRSRNEETKETFVQGVALVEIFLSQPWFSRRWIIQEVAWAQRCMLYCGQNSLSWEELSEWAEAFGMFLTKSLPCGAMTAPNDLNNGFRMIDVINKAFRCGSSNGSRSYMLDLEYLVTSLAPFEVSIPHDQVYALLSLASRQPPGRPKTKFPSGAYGEPLVVLDTRNMNMVGYHVDYNQPYDEFCKEFVQFSVMMSSSIDIICRPWAANLDLSRIKLPSQGIQLPSWIATINRANLTHQPVNGDILVKLQGPSQTRYMSSGGKQVDFTSLRFKKYCSGWSLFVRGFVLDEVKQKSVASQEGNIPYEWSKFAKWEDFDNDPPDGYWRTLVADQGTSTTTAAPSFYRRAVKDLYSGAAKKGFDILAQQTIQSDVGRVVRNVMEKIQSIICNRSLARIGHSGALGLVPRDTQIGDLICVLYGCYCPEGRSSS